MFQSFSRLVTTVVLAIPVLAFADQATAQARPHVARGAAQFISQNDFVGSGHATHLGHYTEAGSVTFAPTSQPTLLTFEGKATYTAANGDLLRATLSGTLDTATGVIAATVTYVGGTGRFVGASGSSSLAGQMLGGGAATIAVAGSIDY